MSKKHSQIEAQFVEDSCLLAALALAQALRSETVQCCPRILLGGPPEASALSLRSRDLADLDLLVSVGLGVSRGMGCRSL